MKHANTHLEMLFIVAFADYCFDIDISIANT